MKRYVALLSPDGAPGDPEAWRLPREGFAPLALAFPVPWLLVSRLWLAALVAFAIPIAVAAMLGPTPGIVASFATGLAVAWEGRNWRIAKWERHGWRYVAGFFARDRAEAEDYLAVLATGAAAESSAPPSANPPARQDRSANAGPIRFSDRRNRRTEAYGPMLPPSAPVGSGGPA